MDNYINKITQGDCLELMKDLPDNSIDMILCDLPYNITQNKWDSIIDMGLLWKRYDRIIKDTTNVVLFGCGMFTASLMLSNRCYWKYNLVWDKSHSVDFLNVHIRPMRKHEDIIVFYKKFGTYNPQIEDKPIENIRPATLTDRTSANYGYFKKGDFRTIPRDKTYPKSIIKISSANKSNIIHPTQKPVDLFRYLIRTYSNKNDIVLDNCSGSGTTAISCHRENRKFICFEKEPKYVEASQQRLEDERAQMKLFN